MELRSTRSRSKTPFEMASYETFNKVSSESGNHVERTYVRSSKTTTTAYRSSNENATSSTDEVTSFTSKPTRRSTRSERSTKKLYKTSDYSSEEGENEVSSTKTISQNEKNQLIEDAKAAANGNSEVSALELYKKSGRYWDIYPKTDWTYSYHSKDRVELAPGVVAMPNMSRKTIHSVHESDSLSYSDYAHKETNTESLLTKSSSAFNTSAQLYKPRQLFNNNYDDKYEGYQKFTAYSSSYWSRTKRTVVSIYTSIFSIFYYLFEVQTSWFSKLHQFTSRVMLFDTWLLQKVNPRQKSSKIALLILLPLLLLGGWWILSSLGTALYGAYLNSTTVNLEDSITVAKAQAPLIITDNTINENLNKRSDNIIVEEYKEISKQTSDLTSEQLASILDYLKNNWDGNKNELDTETLVKNVVMSPTFQNILNDFKTTSYNNLNVVTEKNDEVIDKIQSEINKIRQEMSEAEKNHQEDLLKILTKAQEENLRKYQHLSVQLRQCCRRSIINIENYVEKILTNLMNDEDFLKNQEGFIKFMHGLFAAKTVLESDLRNITSTLDAKYESLIIDNSRIIMDDVGKRIKVEVNNQIENIQLNDGGGGGDKQDLSEIQIKRIVKKALSIYDADRTGLVDYAMETMGGQILTTRCTENYHYGKAVVSVLGIPLWYPVNSPRTVITPSINPGECWAFQNFPGFVVIQLSNMVEIEAFSLEHISKLLVPEGKIDSAPKEFEVYGLTMEIDKEPVLLGTYVYDYDGEPLQFFEVQNKGHVFGIIEVRIISNHGNPNYTCLYRFRVHGKLAKENS